MKMDYNQMLVNGDVDSILNSVREVCGKKLTLKGYNSYVTGHDDAVQEVLVEVYKGIKNYDTSKAKLNTYIEAIINNQIALVFRVQNYGKNKLMSQSSRLSSPEFSEESMEIGCIEDYNIRELKISLKNSLTDIELKVLDYLNSGFQQSEIAIVMKCTPARVSQHVREIRNKVKKLI